MIHRMLCAISLALCSAPSLAQDYPSRPVKLIVPFAAGGPADIYARFMAQRLQSELGQSFVVEDKPGGGSVIGTDQAARRPPTATPSWSCRTPTP